ncbi:MAG: response regulator [Candidatus Omnitrophica bacterium]|nr:response regulator [Candidatus Omnitrophota bacterium]
MIKILVVDDEQMICELVKEVFERKGHTVYAEVNPVKALSIVEKEGTQVVLLDVVMPEMDGLEVLGKIKAKNKDIKVIIITFLEDEETRQKAMDLGADAFLTKPFVTEDLEDLVMNKIQEVCNLEGGK